MQKFLKIALSFVILFVLIVAVQFVLKTIQKEDEQKNEQAQANIPPEQLKQQLMSTISDKVLNEFLDNIILNIQIDPQNNRANVTLSLQANEFLNENTLLKDSYNLFTALQHETAINQLTLKWHMLVQNANTEVLSIQMDGNLLADMETISYQEIPNIALSYKKNSNLK